MLNLASTDLLSVITSSTANIDAVVSYADSDQPMTPTSNVGPLTTPTAIATATTTTICAAPASGVRNVKSVSLRNRHASTSGDVTVQLNRSTTLYQLIFVTLLAGEALVRDDKGIWFHYDSNGGVYGQALPLASDTVAGGIEVATQLELEAASSTTLAVTPGRQHFHPSATKAWVTAGVTGNILASYNITSVTDTGTGDIAVTIATDFSSANYAIAMAVQRINSTAAEANSRIGTIKTASIAAGSFSMDCWDTTATTNVIKDPTSWHAICCGDL